MGLTAVLNFMDVPAVVDYNMVRILVIVKRRAVTSGCTPPESGGQAD